MKRYPALTAFFLCLSGILAGAYLVSLPPGFSLILIFFLFFIFSFFLQKKSTQKSFYLLLFLVGMTIFYFRSLRQQSLFSCLRPNLGKDIQVEGTIDEIVNSSKKNQAVIRVNSIRNKDLSCFSPDLKLLAFFPRDTLSQASPGTSVSLKAKVSLFHATDIRSFSFFAKKISGLAFIRKKSQVRLHRFQYEKSFSEKLRSVINKRLEKILSLGLTHPDARDIHLALMLGERAGLSGTIQEQFKKTGTFHIFSISGLHFATVIFSFLLILKMFRCGENARFLLLTGFALLYLFITRARISSIRAFVMMLVLLTSKKLYRDYNPLNALGVSGLVFLIHNPFQLFAAGFQLSFSAVLGLTTMNSWITDKWDGLLATRFERPRSNSLLRSLSRKTRLAFTASFSAWAFTVPVLLFHFQEFSLLASLANVVIIPLVYIAIQLGVLSALTGLVLPYFSIIINLLSQGSLVIVLAVVDYFYSSAFFIVRGDKKAALFIALAAAAFVAFYLLREHKNERNKSGMIHV
ncbi:MAG: ComEC/Rec2 family competence protein [Candidatus Aureabacteria bacterium]|nr:ComEC/Rec2 family competence protein [Candidatus Auribacterota bacterium]